MHGSWSRLSFPACWLILELYKIPSLRLEIRAHLPHRPKVLKRIFVERYQVTLLISLSYCKYIFHRVPSPTSLSIMPNFSYLTSAHSPKLIIALTLGLRYRVWGSQACTQFNYEEALKSFQIQYFLSRSKVSLISSQSYCLGLCSKLKWNRLSTDIKIRE
jgi:hypothetical protein